MAAGKKGREGREEEEAHTGVKRKEGMVTPLWVKTNPLHRAASRVACIVACLVTNRGELAGMLSGGVGVSTAVVDA